MKLFVVCALLGALCSPVALQTRKTPSRPSTAKPKPVATPVKKPNDAPEWDRVTTIADRSERIAALEQFIATFPKSPHLNEARGLIAAARVEAGNDDIASGNIEAAITEYKAAVAVVPTPIVQGFWDAGLSKIPANLYFRDRRQAALDIAKDLETKAATSSAQLLSLAGFYLAIEDGANVERIANSVIFSEPTSASAYQILGFAKRMQFRLDDSSDAFAKAIELAPDSIQAKQGLAEMKRALGKPDEAVALYDQILAKDPQNIPARNGHVLALFDAERRADAEAEMAKVLEDVPNDFLLIGSAAYWYAAHHDGTKAVELAQKAISIEPRFIWSHFALARGLLLQGEAAKAEQTLVAARRYGNFPTLEYELASARLSAGYYREAAEDLVQSFKVSDGQISTVLGGRIARVSKSFTELVADERRASIFEPTAADDPDAAAHLAALLAFQQTLSAPDIDEKTASADADEFAKGSDAMHVHRELYAASQLLEKKIALQKVIELAKAAIPDVDVGLTVPVASTAVMASELYTFRATAAARGEYVNVPEVPRAKLSAIMRGRIEDMIGWADYQTGANDEAVIHLRRAVGVLPSDSAWSRASIWRLGAALASAGKDAEALEMYIKSYKGSQPDAIRYSVIEALYRKVNGSSDGLSAKIGDNPAEARTIPSDITSPRPTPEPTPDLVSAVPRATPVPTPQPTPVPDSSPIATPMAIPEITPKPESSPSAIPTPETSPAVGPVASPTATPSPEPLPVATPQATSSATPTAELSPSSSAGAAATPTPVPGNTPLQQRAADEQTVNPDLSAQAKKTDLFPPVVITIPSANAKNVKSAAPTTEPTPPASEEVIPPCPIAVSSDSLRLNRSGGSQAVIVGREDNGNIDGLEVAGTPEIVVRREPVAGVSSRALFVIRAVTARAGLFQVTFKLPCGSKTLDVNIH